MRLFELFESSAGQKREVFVVYGGGFQPFHRGHLGSYLQALEKFPDSELYVAASNDTKVRPIPFEDKKFLAEQAGVRHPFVLVKTPINPKEIMQNYDPESDIFILVRSERDPMSYTKKDGSPGYYQPFVDIKKCKSFNQHGYVFVTRKEEFSVLGQTIFSGSQVREMYSTADDQQKYQIIQDLYPDASDIELIKEKLDLYLS